MIDLLGLVFFLAFVVAPISNILKRLGLSPLWALISLVPVVNLIALNYVAFAKWPFNIDRKDRAVLSKLE